MDWQDALLLYSILIVSLLVAGMAIGTVMGFVGLVGVSILAGPWLWMSFGDIIWHAVNSFTLTAVPLFVLMGEIILRSGISRRFYRGVATLFGWIPGGLAQSTVAGCAVFSAISGSSTATAMTIGTVSLPEMRSRGYQDRLTLGTLAGGSCLGILIPPSIPLVIYAAVVKEPLLELFMAGLVPGLLLALLFSLYLVARSLIDPSLAPRDTLNKDPFVLLQATIDCAPVIALVVAIIGGMYFGVVTPTEAAAFGCLCAFGIGLAYGGMSIAEGRTALKSAVVTSAVVMFIIINSQILSFAIVHAGVARGVAQALVASELSFFVMFLALFIMYLVMGIFMDGISMMLLTMPVLYPTLMAMGVDGVWFGIMLIVMIELGQLTPPMGLNLFAVQSIAGRATLGEIALSSAPFALITAGLCFLVFAFPDLALWLPRTMREMAL